MLEEEVAVLRRELANELQRQAVVAVENARLVEAVQARTTELAEALERQTATSEVLGVISRAKFDIQPVLDTIVTTAARLCQAEMADIARVEGDSFVTVATHGYDAVTRDYLHQAEVQPGRGTLQGRVALGGGPIHIPDCLSDPDYNWLEGQAVLRQRSMLGVPLQRDGAIIGTITLMRRRVEPFTDKQIALVATFADQAVIAIENVRLFEEVQARTRELSELLERQTATSEILSVINRSGGDLQPVFAAVLQNAVRICAASFGVIYRYDGDGLQIAALHNVPAALAGSLTRGVLPPCEETATGRAILAKATTQSVGRAAAEDGAAGELSGASGEPSAAQTTLAVPLLRNEEPIGVITLYRQESRAFSDEQIDLLSGFADQAAIAIENARLLGELRQRTDDLGESLQQQTATADVLKIISRSTIDLGVVLQTLVESAAHLAEADKATITRQVGGVLYRAESYGFSPEFMARMRALPVVPERGTISGRVLLENRTVHIHDIWQDADYQLIETQRIDTFRTVLGVPMLREGVAIGVMVLTRGAVRPFTQKQIELVTTFADQAAIAIENARLFESVQERTRELGRSLEELRAAQDRLVQTEKLASLGQLTAGIAHEIKNPLNFINNFGALGSELVEELMALLDRAPLDEELRAEIGELAALLRGNLDKVVQHGKRADSIVKNMLLHSREGSGERRPVEINAVVEEALNLAYHGARAEKPGFNVTIERLLDPAAGTAELFPQEITRVFLNLIGNGFYAVSKRKAAGEPDYEPTLAAATRDLGDKVEVRIRDNGTGIPPEALGRIFNPFFTTKPAGEGTGLGLSLSHDIVVKQHGGSIDVDTVPGAFTEFRIVLPRVPAQAGKQGGQP